jgi:hypothetical protein
MTDWYLFVERLQDIDVYVRIILKQVKNVMLSDSGWGFVVQLLQIHNKFDGTTKTCMYFCKSKSKCTSFMDDIQQAGSFILT